MAKDAHMPRAPRLPAGCVDMNKLHRAARTNTAPGEALDAARIETRRGASTRKPAARAAATVKAQPAPSKE